MCFIYFYNEKGFIIMLMENKLINIKGCYDVESFHNLSETCSASKKRNRLIKQNLSTQFFIIIPWGSCQHQIIRNKYESKIWSRTRLIKIINIYIAFQMRTEVICTCKMTWNARVAQCLNWEDIKPLWRHL